MAALPIKYDGEIAKADACLWLGDNCCRAPVADLRLDAANPRK
jgi:hypothetical protein